MEGPDNVAEVPHCRRFATVFNHFLLQHAIEDQLATAAQGMCRVGHSHQCDEQGEGEKRLSDY
jgi:hypothetical protein